MPYIDADAVHGALEWTGTVAALREAHRGERPQTGRLLLTETDDALLVLPAWRRGSLLGVKLATVFPGNLGSGVPSVQAAYVVFDGRDGRHVATVDGTALTYRKTASDSALAADILARHDSRVLLMVGAGGLAPYLIDAHRAVRPSLERVLVWNRTPARAHELAESLVGCDAAAVDDLEAAVRGADVISCATMSTEPLVRGAWLQDGSHVDLVGAYQPHMREADAEAIARAKVFIDNPETTVEESGDLVIPIAEGVIGPEHVQGDLFDLCSGRVSGRSAPGDITLFENGGGAHLDLMVASYLLERLS